MSHLTVVPPHSYRDVLEAQRRRRAEALERFDDSDHVEWKILSAWICFGLAAAIIAYAVTP